MGGAIACGNLKIEGNTIVKNNTAVGGLHNGIIFPAGVANDIWSMSCLEINGGTIGDVVFMSSQLGGSREPININGGTLNNIIFLDMFITDGGENSMTVPADGILNINADFTLTGSIKLSGADNQIINVNSHLAKTYKIDGSAENFASYYQDTGKAIVTYADGIEVDKNDFTCTNGSIITSAQVEGGSATSLYLTAPTESTPSTGFVDEQLLPALLIGCISLLVVVATINLNKKQRKNI